MPKLVAIQVETESHKPETRWEQELPRDAKVVLGRSSRSDWVADWESVLSRRHATLSYREGRLNVEVLPEATNPLIYQGKHFSGGLGFELKPGERFGVGKTIFEFRDETPPLAPDGPEPTESKTVRSSDLDRVTFTDADKRIDALAEFHNSIRDSADEGAFDTEVLKVLLKGIPQADAAALVTMPARDAPTMDVSVAATRARIESARDFQPSRKLIIEAIHTRKDPVVHTWDATSSGFVPPSGLGDSKAPPGHRFDWAFCVPVPHFGTERWGLYVAGRFPSRLNRASDEDDLQINRDIKFAGLVSKVLASHRRVGYLQHRYDILARFLSSSVRQALGRAEITEVLRQREVTVTVLFCDLRGSCKISEDGQGDLMGLWTSISAALSIMTSSITEQNGVIGDFQGDAAMGFWGWPIDQGDSARRACLAALEIRTQFEANARRQGHPLANFQMGIGIAHGRAIAGALGTYEQFKVSVYGPPVNLAARLESLTKQFRVPILLDDAAAAKLRGTAFSTRRLARIRPYGLSHELTISELYQPMVLETTLSEDERGEFDVGYEHFLSGEWQVARRKLAVLKHDGASLFLTRFMDDHPTGPPDGWDGVISIKSK